VCVFLRSLLVRCLELWRFCAQFSTEQHRCFKSAYCRSLPHPSPRGTKCLFGLQRHGTKCHTIVIDHVGAISCCVWSSSRVGPWTDPVPAVHRRLAATGQASSASSNCLRRRHHQIYGFCRPSEVEDLSRKVFHCVDEVSASIKVNRLLLNPSKTEVLWCSSARRQHQILTSPIQFIGSTSVLPVSLVRDLGVYLEADVTMKTHVIGVARSCFAALRQIRSVQRSLPRHALLTLIRTLVISKVDCYAARFWSVFPATFSANYSRP